MKRRNFLSCATAACALGVLPAYAQEPLQMSIGPEAMPFDPNAPRIVEIQPGIPPYEIHLDPSRFALYWTLPDATAVRYAVGVGRPGLYEPGAFTVGAKKEWPAWTPTPDMIERSPELYAQYADGMPGGVNNPLGARALYLFTPERGDTFLRIHGTNAPDTIGTAVSNGCARLVNEQIIELYDKVPVGTQVFLYPQGPMLPA
jgi:lipoprotein-anchoring transpeptidase ErfK/SrfK